VSTDDPQTGLRERKKQRTRESISDIATALFIERGFENVTLAEIAVAADVSVGTIVNYFGTKEDLFFDRADEVLAILRAAIAERPQGTTATAAVHRLLREQVAPIADFAWKLLDDPELYARFRAFRRTEHASPALRARRLVLLEEWVAPLAVTLAEELGLGAGDQRADAMASMLLAAMATRDRALSEALLTGASPRTLKREVQGVVDEAFGRVARAFDDIDRPA
jgi:AcrR family transcriptional regulator